MVIYNDHLNLQVELKYVRAWKYYKIITYILIDNLVYGRCTVELIT